MTTFTNGIFVEECKNRFLCLVKIKRETHLCYVASSARLSNFVDLVGKKVLLLANKGANTRTRYTLYAVKSEHGYIALKLSVANTLLEDIMRKEYPRSISIQKEKSTPEGYKSDLLIYSTPQVIVEAKSIITDKDTVAFPSVAGERSMKQFSALQDALRMGYRVRYCLVLLSPTIREMVLDSSKEEFCIGLEKCIQLGMLIEIYRLRNTRKLRFYLERDNELEYSVLRKEVLFNA